MLEMIAKAWQFLRDVVMVVRPCRFSLLVVVAGAALLPSPPGNPASAKVGTSGRAGMRFALETARAGRRPALICGRGPEIAMLPIDGSPITTAVTAAPAPRK